MDITAADDNTCADDNGQEHQQASDLSTVNTDKENPSVHLCSPPSFNKKLLTTVDYSIFTFNVKKIKIHE